MRQVVKHSLTIEQIAVLKVALDKLPWECCFNTDGMRQLREIMDKCGGLTAEYLA